MQRREEHNILLLLNRRVITTKDANHNIGRRISRSLLKSTRREYKNTWSRKTNHGFTYNGQFCLGSAKTPSFHEYYRGCYNSINQPHFVRTYLEQANRKHGIGASQQQQHHHHQQQQRLPQRSWKIRDTLLYESPTTCLNDTNGLLSGLYDTCVFALTSDSYLIQYVQPRDGWEVRRQIYLGAQSFTNMHYDGETTDRIVVKSKRNPINHVGNIGRGDLYCYCVLFQACPFELEAVFGVMKSAFGEQVKDVFVASNMLVVLDQNSYSFYNLDDVIRQGMLSHGNAFKLLQQVGGSGGSGKRKSSSFPKNVKFLGGEINQTNNQPIVVGKYPYGLPVNVHIKALPELLLKIPNTSSMRGLTFGGFPWYCLASFHDTSKVFSLETGRVLGTLQHGKYSHASIDDEKKTYFHGDCSGRLLSLEYDEIK